MDKVKVSLVNTFRDGGTQQYKGEDGKDYYLDGRISSTTVGEVYDRYPGDAGAVKLDVMLIPPGMESLLYSGGSTHEGEE